MDDEDLTEQRVVSAAGADQVAAAMFEDSELPALLDGLTQIAQQIVTRLCDRGVPLHAAISVVVGGIAGRVVERYSE